MNSPLKPFDPQTYQQKPIEPSHTATNLKFKKIFTQSWLITIFGLFGVIILVGIAYLFYSNQEQAKLTQITQLPPPPTVTPLPSATPTPSWQTYTNQNYAFTTSYYSTSSPTEVTGSGEPGQFSYLLRVNFGTNPVKSQYGYTVEVNRTITPSALRQELVGHITDAIDSEAKTTFNKVVWTKLNYQLYVTTTNIPFTTAFTNRGKYGYLVTAPTVDIDRILSSFTFN